MIKSVCALLVCGAVLLPAGLYDTSTHGYDPLQGVLSDASAYNAVLDRATTRAVAALTNEQLAGQVLMPSFEKGTSVEAMAGAACDLQLGGVMVLRSDITPLMVAQLREATANCLPNMPFWVSIDAEPSLMQYRLPDAGVFANTRDLHTEEEVENESRRIAQVLQQHDIDINFAPVADGGANTAVIGNRSFGGSMQHIGAMSASFIRAHTSEGVISAVKHFPGHGSAVGDTHNTLESVPGALEELPAFAAAIEASVPMVMVGHLVVTDGAYDTAGVPATLSPIIMQSLLREEVGFKGVVVTDSMSMGAVRNKQNTAVRAVAAGADVVLMPYNVRTAHAQLFAAIENDAQFRAKVTESVTRIVRLKIAQQWAEGFRKK